MIKKFEEFVNEDSRSEHNFHYDNRFAVDQDEYGYRELYLYFDDNYEYVNYHHKQMRNRMEVNFVELLTVEEDEFDGIRVRATHIISDVFLMNVNSERVILIPDRQIDSRNVLRKFNEISKYEETTLKTSEINIDCIKFTPKDGGEVTDEFFVEFINFILDNTDEPYIKKDDYYRSWSDYHKNIDARKEELRNLRNTGEL